MTLHCHKVSNFPHDGTVVKDGEEPLRVPAGWQIADGDAEDICVCSTFCWHSDYLVFANGDIYYTANDPSYRGTRSGSVENLNFVSPQNREKSKIWQRLSYTG
jgi:hypothetical protein